MFIVFEGIDGAGKTTVIKRTKEYLESKGKVVVVTKEPTDDSIGKYIEMNDDLNPETEALLFTADRASHTDEIRKWLSEGKVVITDRYYASTLAYQSAAGMDMEWLRKMNMKVIEKPTVTFLLDIDPKVSLDRVGKRGEKSRFEKLEYLKDVRYAYLSLAKTDGFTVIDASGSENEVANSVIDSLSRMI